MRAVKSVSIDSERRVIITYLDGSTETLYPNCIWCDSEALRQLIKDLLEEKADAITQTIENVTIASFADGADEGLIKKLLVSIEPIQEGSGDPSPDNVRPISGRTGLSVFITGKNLLPPTIHDIAPGLGIIIQNSDYRSLYAHIPSSGTYTISRDTVTGNRFRIYGLYNDPVPGPTTIVNISTSQDDVLSKTFTVPDGIKVILIYLANDGSEITSKFQLEIGSTATDYEPYKSNTYSVNWETEAGTVYGGSLDVVSGKLTVDGVSVVFNGTERWTLVTGANPYCKLKVGDLGTVVNKSIITDYFPTVSIASSTDNQGINIVNSTGSNGAFISVRYDSLFTSVDELKAYLAEHPLFAVYKLTARTEIQLTPHEITTLLGNNNIWSDSGNILELEYTADTKLYIGEQQSGTLGSNMHTITIPDLQPVSEKTWEDVEESADERGEE